MTFDSFFIRAWLDDLRERYWFIPTVFTLVAIALALGVVELDRVLGSEWIAETTWLFANQPDGARAVLSTIAGTMITVAGVVFSITIAAVSYTTSQFGPRMFTNFMRDRGNQVTLGVFLGTFIYCLLVLRTVRAPDEAAAAASAAAEAGPSIFAGFVPQIAVLGSVVLAMASLGVLIYFIHHIPDTIHVSHVIAAIGHDLHDRIDRFSPMDIGLGLPDDHDEGEGVLMPPELREEAAFAIAAARAGYVQHLDEEGLLDLAEKHNLVMRLQCHPGDFVYERSELVLLWAGDQVVAPKLVDEIQSMFGIGRKRTPSQDIMFLVNELVEIAARALSPGVNDPFTATNCMDWLASVLARIRHFDTPPSWRCDARGTVRMVTRRVDFESMADASFAQLRPYVSSDRIASTHMMRLLAGLGRGHLHEEQREVLAQQARSLRQACQENLTLSSDREAIDEECRETMEDILAEYRHRLLGAGPDEAGPDVPCGEAEPLPKTTS